MRISELNKFFLAGEGVRYKNDQILVFANKVDWLYHGNIIASRIPGNNYIEIFQGWGRLSATTKRRLNNFKNVRLFHKNSIAFISHFPYNTFQEFNGSAIIPIPNW